MPVTIAANAGSLGPVVDNNPAAPRNVTFTVSGLPAGAPADVQADFTMNPVHTWGGDIDATLIAPDGTQFVMFASTGATTATGVGDSSDLSGPYVFTDSAAGTNWWAAAATAGTAEVIPPGSYRTTQAGPQGAANFSPPTNLTAAFAGVANPNGTWTMRFTDNAAGDTGAVSAANLRLTGTGMRHRLAYAHLHRNVDFDADRDEHLDAGRNSPRGLGPIRFGNIHGG